MSDFNIYLTVPKYLEQWMTNSFGNPVQLIKDSPEMRLLNELLVITPKNKTPDTGEGSNITIPIPYFKGKDPESYNYIHESGKVALIESFSTLFKKNLITEITALGNGHVKRAKLIYAFMEKHGIDEDHWDTVAQIHNRVTTKYFRKNNIKISGKTS